MEARKVGKLSHLWPELRKVFLGYASSFGTSNLEGGELGNISYFRDRNGLLMTCFTLKNLHN